MATNKDEQVVSCEACYFFHCTYEHPEGKFFGDCRFNSPVLVTSLDGNSRTEWPEVESVDFCGQFRRDDDGC